MSHRSRRERRVDAGFRRPLRVSSTGRRCAALIAVLAAVATFETRAQVVGAPAVPAIPGQSGVGQGPTMQTGTGQTLRIDPAISSQLMWTDNVDLTAVGKRSDFVLQLTPSLTIAEKGANTALSGTISAPILLYANTGGRNNRVSPEVSLQGTASLYPRLLYVDGSVEVSQQFVSPFAPRPQSLANATNNRYTAQSYRISPYLKGDGPADIHYELRDTNTWTNSNATATGDRAYTNEVIGRLTQDPRPFGLDANYDRVETKFSNQDSFITEIGRLGEIWQPDARWRFDAHGGYEDNRFLLERFSGFTYGAGVRWRPGSRTSLDAEAEHRFFGTSYHVSFAHRTPLTIWTLRAVRDITTYPQQLASLPEQANVAALLDALFASRITDPAARQTFVDQLIQERGLPSTLSTPLNLFTQQATLQQSIDAGVTLLGARNTILVTVYRRRTQPIPGTDVALLDLLSASQIDNTQTGTNAAWTYRLTPFYTLSTSADWNRTVANDQSDLHSRQLTLQTSLSAAVSKLTRLFGGIRYQRFTSNPQATIEETALFVGLDHAFR